MYALRYAYRQARAYEHFYTPSDCTDRMDMAYYAWLIIDGDSAVVVDTGFTAAVAAARGRSYVASPVETMAALGVGPHDVSTVVLTHLHYDHTGHVSAFPDAEIVVQAAEMRFWTGPDASLGDYPALGSPDDIGDLVAANFAGRLRWVDGDAGLDPAVSVHRVGGHTPGSQVVRIDTHDTVVVLASDASHFYANYSERRPYSIVHTLPQMYTAFDRIAELAGPRGVVVPGHDPGVMDAFPSPTPELSGRAVRIA